MKTYSLLLAALLSIFASGESAQKRITMSATAGVVPGSEKWPFYPVCLMIEQGAGNLNQLGQSLVKGAAECQVNIVVEAFYVTAARGGARAMEQTAVGKCNILDVYKNVGAKKATVALVTNQQGVARQMCQTTMKERVGCARPPKQPDPRLKSILEHQGLSSEPAPRGKPSFAVIEKGNNDEREINKQVLGMSMMGLVEGVSFGNGVGDPETEGQGGAGGANEIGWKGGAGGPLCERMRAAAFPNTRGFRFTEAIKFSEDDSKAIDLNDGKPLWRDGITKVEPGKHPVGAGGSGDLGGYSLPSGGQSGAADAGSTVRSSEAVPRTPSTRNPGGRSPSPAAAALSPDPQFKGGGHPMPKDDSNTQAGQPQRGPDGASKKSGPRLGMDESARSGSTSGSSLGGGATVSPTLNPGAGASGGAGGGPAAGGGPIINKLPDGRKEVFTDDLFDETKKKKEVEKESGRRKPTKSAY